MDRYLKRHTKKTMIIELSKGQTTLIDDEDFEKVSKYKWYCNNYGYAVRTERTSDKRIVHWLHRFILNCPDHMEIDHINHNPLDNRKSNLRVCERKENCRNIRTPTHNTSGYKGVSLSQNKKRWRAYICRDNKQIGLGTYNTKEEAALAYNKKAIEIFGEYAKLNVVEKE